MTVTYVTITHDIILHFLFESKIIKIKIKTKDKITKSLVFNSNIIFPSKFLFSFLKYSSLNFPLSYSYNIFIIYFPSNSLLLKSLFSFISNFSCISYTTINPFYYTKYFTTSFICLLFNLFILQLYLLLLVLLLLSFAFLPVLYISQSY